MRAWIKYKGSKEDNYTRYGKPIPHFETEIDIRKHFACSEEREKYIAMQLKSDSRILCRMDQSATACLKEKTKELKNTPLNKDKFRDDIKKKYEKKNEEAK